MDNKRNIISFPHMGNYHIPIGNFLKIVLNAEVISPPAITKKTLELGSKNSPDFVCVPFKYNLGNFIEALDNGANILIQAGGGCRFGFYGEVQEQILKDLGYKFTFLKSESTFSIIDYYNIMKRINPKITLLKFIKYFLIVCSQIIYMDKVDEYIRENIGFEEKKGQMEIIHKQFLKDITKCNSKKQVKILYKNCINQLKKVKINKDKNILKVGIIGELYTAMEPFSTYFLEKELAKKNIEVKRFINLSYLLFYKPKNEKKIFKNCFPYLKYDIGADGIDSICNAKNLGIKKYDGLIHTKPFGCIPEINAMPVLQNISKDFNIPIMYLSFDSNTSETGISTRLEAFCDMLKMRRDKLLYE